MYKTRRSNPQRTTAKVFRQQSNRSPMRPLISSAARSVARHTDLSFFSHDRQAGTPEKFAGGSMSRKIRRRDFIRTTAATGAVLASPKAFKGGAPAFIFQG